MAKTPRPRTLARARITAAEDQVIRDAHRALEARGRGKGAIHTTTEACRVIAACLTCSPR